LEPKYWAKLVMLTTYLKARSPHKAVQGIMLEKLWSGRKPLVNYL
jgi:hypothetical protein